MPVSYTHLDVYKRQDIENKDKEIYDLKHDLISNQVKTENAEASMKMCIRDSRLNKPL